MNGEGRDLKKKIVGIMVINCKLKRHFCILDLEIETISFEFL